VVFLIQELLGGIKMPGIPELNDWQSMLERKLQKASYTENEILEIIHLCQEFLIEIQPASLWLGQQNGFVNQMQRIFTEMYFTRFNKQPPPRPMEAPVNEIVLNTTELRKQAIRDVALSLTEPGDDISDEAILKELERRGMRMDLINPTATISTILRGFKPHFEKVAGKRGLYTRRE
jgi:hypothetical protein